MLWGIRPSSTPGETGLTNPSHAAFPRDLDLTLRAALRLNLLNLTRFQVISLHFTLTPNASWRSDNDGVGAGVAGGPGRGQAEGPDLGIDLDANENLNDLLQDWLTLQ